METFTPGDIVVTKRPITMGHNGNVIQAGTVGIVVGKNRSQKIRVQFELGRNETTPIIGCFPSNLRSL